MRKQLYSLADVIAAMTPVQTIVRDPSAYIGSLLYDSRKLTGKTSGLFFALKGTRDGHEYIPDVYAAGIRNFVVAENRISVDTYPDANFLVVKSPLRAMQELAGFHRQRFNYPVIGITGSNGKTIVKEWLYELLSPEYRIIRSPKSYNSQLGVALSLWEMDDTYDLAIIEAGISKEGEMAALSGMIRPTIGILTTIGRAHDAGFPTTAAKIKEKLKLFESAELVIYHPDHIQEMSISTRGRIFSWGRGDVTLQLHRHELIDGRLCKIHARYKGEEISITIPFIDGAARENAICCWATLLAMGYKQSVIAERMIKLQPMEMRLEMKPGINNCSIVDDSYSNDLSSLMIALDFLKQQRQHHSYSVILSDFPESDNLEEELYDRVSKLLFNNKISRLISVGEVFMRHRDKFAGIIHNAFLNTDDLLAALPGLTFNNETILIKGARKFAFERVSRTLTAKLHETVFEINLNALEHNLSQYRLILQDEVKLMAMVKAFSYGSGSFEIANLLQFNRVDYLAVAYADEGVELRKAGIHLPIMVMSPSGPSFDALLAHTLEPELFGFSVFNDFVRLLSDRGIKDYPVHIKVDTGMHRLGFSVEEIEPLIDLLLQTDTVKVQSVFSHLVASDDPHEDDFTTSQLAVFNVFTKKLQQALGYPFLRHVANTAAIQRWPQAQLDMVRLGIGLYGIGSQHEPLSLQPAGTLKTTVTQLRKVHKGESVGYGRSSRLAKDSTIATVKIGYADGYDRRFGNGVGYMTIHGTRLPTVGNICMDMTMLDVGLIDIQEGDEVIVFDDIVTAARSIGTIPYELLTGISQRVKRVYYYE